MPRGDEPPHPLEIAFAQEWNAGQLGQQHIADAINKIGEAWRQDRAALAEAAAQIVQLRAQVAELEGQKAVNVSKGS